VADGAVVEPPGALTWRWSAWREKVKRSSPGSTFTKECERGSSKQRRSSETEMLFCWKRWVTLACSKAPVSLSATSSATLPALARSAMFRLMKWRGVSRETWNQRCIARPKALESSGLKRPSKDSYQPAL
jgi:hypothetical protein